MNEIPTREQIRATVSLDHLLALAYMDGDLMTRAEWEARNDTPWLGLATNRQLLEELTARLEIDGMLNYRTVEAAMNADTTREDRR